MWEARVRRAAASCERNERAAAQNALNRPTTQRYNASLAYCGEQTWLCSDAVVRFDPTDVWSHNHVAVSLCRRFPALAHAAATRALLLMPREDKHGLRVQLRRIIEESRRPEAEASSGAARALLSELQASPGKRSRASLRTLCMQAAPEVADLPQKEPEPLPDSAALAQLRRDLQTLPRPLPVVPESRPLRGLLGEEASPPLAATTVPVRPGKVGRNDPCPCGSGGSGPADRSTIRAGSARPVLRMSIRTY